MVPCTDKCRVRGLAKVSELWAIVSVKHHILKPDVPVSIPCRMNMLQAVEQLLENVPTDSFSKRVVLHLDVAWTVTFIDGQGQLRRRQCQVFVEIQIGAVLVCDVCHFAQCGLFLCRVLVCHVLGHVLMLVLPCSEFRFTLQLEVQGVELISRHLVPVEQLEDELAVAVEILGRDDLHGFITSLAGKRTSELTLIKLEAIDAIRIWPPRQQSTLFERCETNRLMQHECRFVTFSLTLFLFLFYYRNYSLSNQLYNSN